MFRSTLPAGRSQPDSLAEGAGRRGLPAGKPDSQLETLDLPEVFGMLRRHLVLIFLVTAVTVLAAALAVYRQQPAYRATAMLRFADARSALAEGFEGPGEGAARQSASTSLLSELEILKSRTIAAQVVDAEGLRLQPASEEFSTDLLEDVSVDPAATVDTLHLAFSAGGVRARSGSRQASGKYGSLLKIGGVAFAVTKEPEVQEAIVAVLPRDFAVDRLLESLNASPREPTNVIDVGYVADDPTTAQRVLDRLITIFQVANAEHAQQQSRRRREFLEQQIARTDSIFAAKQLALSSFRSNNRVYSTTQDKITGQQAGLLALQMRQGDLDADLRMYRSLLSGLRQSPSNDTDEQLRAFLSAPGIATNPVLSSLYEQLVQYQTQREALTTGKWASAASNPDIERLDSLTASTKAKLTSAVHGHIAALDARLGALSGLEARNTADIEVLPQTEAEEVRLVQQVETVRKMSDQLREDYQKAQVAEAVEVGEVEIVDMATLPYHPTGTGSGLKLGFALVLGLLLGTGGAVAKELSNSSIRRYKEVPATLNLPQLAVIPKIEALAPEQSRGRLRLGSAATNQSAKEPGKENHPALALSQMQSPAWEAFRTLRTNLMFSPDFGQLGTLVVTSSLPQEGKSTTAAHLAVVFAQQGVRTLLVDADLRRPSLHRLFRMVNVPGLSSVLEGRYSPADAIRRTSIENLSLLPSGALPANPSEMVGGERMRRLLLGFPDRFDLLIVDSPPLLAAAEGSVLAAEADAVLLVVRAAQTARGAAEQAVEQLATVNARVIGAVLNDPDAEVPRYGDYYSAYNYYAEQQA